MPHRVLIHPHVQAALDGLDEPARHECELALARLAEEFGQPHLHLGVGIRKLRHHTYECRAGLHLRFVFQDTPDGLQVVFLGNHDDVERLLHSGRYD